MPVRKQFQARGSAQRSPSRSRPAAVRCSTIPRPVGTARPAWRARSHGTQWGEVHGRRPRRVRAGFGPACPAAMPPGLVSAGAERPGAAGCRAPHRGAIPGRRRSMHGPETRLWKRLPSACTRAIKRSGAIPFLAARLRRRAFHPTLRWVYRRAATLRPAQTGAGATLSFPARIYPHHNQASRFLQPVWPSCASRPRLWSA